MPPVETALPMLLIWAMIGYLFGSIPFGLVLTAALGLGDIRQIGSGNIGATNVLRTGNKGAALATLILDGAKAAVAVLVARAMAGEDAAQLAGLAAFIGHCFPVWLRFKGGKGVATFLGLLLALVPVLGLLCCASWAVTAAVSRISSLSALMAAALSTVWVVVLDRGDVFFLCAMLTLLVFLTHRANIARLRAGTEPRIGAKT